jgi:NADH:ubiquinone oxidoreductase subunit 2 (subunit N)
MASLAWLIPLLPILAATWIGVGYLFGFNRGEAGERQTAQAALAAAGLALLLILAIDILAVINGVPGQLRFGQWLVSGEYQVWISFTLDALGLAMTTLVAFISFLTIRFSVNYMHREAGFQRFFMILSLFTGAMLLVMMAGNALLVFIGWELAGVSSYLLIGYVFNRTTATENANRAFVTNRIGDAGFIMALFLSFTWTGGVEWSDILVGGFGLTSLSAGLLASGFLLAALAKSAQLPFVPWISRALEGPTPSSAIFYGSLMVHAGVYLVIRLESLFQQVPALMVLLFLIGLLTVLYGYFCGLVQTDIKSALMFSTTAQVGLMFMACGLGWFTLAAWHLALHAMFRAYQFLHAPALLQWVARPARPVPAWLQRRQWLFNASLQRFWLDNLADWLVIRPTDSLSRDLQHFDEQVVNRLVGLPGSAGAVSSLAQWEDRKRGYASLSEEGGVGYGRGVLGSLMEHVAAGLQWFEEQLILKSGGEGLLKIIQRIGIELQQIEQLLSQPRYLWLIIMATFVIII